MPPSPPSEAPTDRPGRFGPQETSAITPGKHYARFLRACDQTAALQARGTSISLFWCPGKNVEKHVVYLWYEDACNIYLRKRAERAARCQRTLDAALEREHVNKDAERTHTVSLQKRTEKRRRGLSDRLDRLYPPRFDEPPKGPESPKYTVEERQDALDDVEEYSTTPHLWAGLKRIRMRGGWPEPCDTSCGMCEYCFM